ncbi:NAD(P)H-dependent oxidoreductase [Orenia marismortui]|uniref:NAD(P)H-dependent oxidoreductase n=1 Tax=Orenia marismortui TaxID=46469 RepID=UPI00037D37D7|nr:NAD(P)H-dependent oxidoreductase [Orenia marismortui]
MENILILNGSPRGKKGNTAKLVDNFITGLKEESSNLIIENIELYKKNINSCTGCFSCWNKTPGKCIFNDDMKDLISSYVNADLVIWATPLYHFGMTSIMKRFTERTLPINKPDIVKYDETYTHPQRYDMNNKKNILISTAGFPEAHNFEVLIDQLNKITGGKVSESILTVMGELLSVKALENRISWYLDAVQQAGKEFISQGSLNKKTKDLLKKELVPIDDFVEMANLTQKTEEKITTEKSQKGYNLLKLMGHSFVPNNANGIDAILEMEFTDLNESNHFIIKDNSCQLKKGPSNNFSAKIITGYEIWQKISQGDLDGPQAMMDGLYKIEGDFDLIQKLDRIFGSSKGKQDNKNQKINIDSRLVGQKAMGISFIPWVFSWIFIESNLLAGVLLPLLLSLGLVAIKKKKYELTYFEKMNTLYFSILSIISLFDYQLLSNIGIELNYFAVASIWGLSVLFNTALTSDYSKYDYEEDLEDNPIFIKTNDILTLFWALMFVGQGVAMIILKNYSYLKYSPLLYILILVAIKFTNYFSKKYPEYIAKGKLKKNIFSS